MTSVALIGFAASGKSTLGKAVKRYCHRSKFAISYRDSDDEIGASHGGSIAEIYANLPYPGACSLIELEERQFLNSIRTIDLPTLIVAGPNTILREPEWSQFLERTKPIIYYLTIGAPLCYDRLSKRHQQLRKKYQDNPNVLSVNRGMLGDLNSHGRFVDYGRDEALRHVSENMCEQVKCYERIADANLTFSAKMNETQKRDVCGAIALDLGVTL